MPIPAKRIRVEASSTIMDGAGASTSESAATLSDKTKIFNCPNHLTNISDKLRTFYERAEFFDVVLVAGLDGTKLQAHRLIISAASDYFRAMFCSAFEDAKAEEVTLENIDGETLKLMLDFMYKAAIPLRSETVESILKAADFFQVNSLIDACCEFLGDELEPANCLGITVLAEQHSYTTLYEKAIAFAYSHFVDVCASAEFLQLDKTHLCRFLFSEDRDVPQELVFQSLVAWVKHDPEKRNDHTYGLMSRVRFASLDPKFIVENTKHVCKSIECYELIRRWLEWHLSPESRSMISFDFIPKREDSKIAFATGTIDFQIQTYNRELNKWTYEEWPLPPKKRVDYGMGVVNGKLIIAGGKISGRVTNLVESLDLQTMEWSELPPMVVARCWPGLAELNGYLYVAGGESGGIWSCSVEVFDFSAKTWTYADPLRVSMQHIQVAVANEKLFAVGNGMASLECFDPSSCQWTTTVGKANGSLNFSMAAFNGLVYAVGGEKDGARRETVERYDPSTNTWAETSSLALGRLYVKCAALNNRLVACVGYDNVGEWVNMVEEYNPDEDEWTVLAPLQTHDCSISSRLFTM